MVLAPPLRVGNLHLIAQDVPHNSWLDPGVERFNDAHAVQIR